MSKAYGLPPWLHPLSLAQRVVGLLKRGTLPPSRPGPRWACARKWLRTHWQRRLRLRTDGGGHAHDEIQTVIDGGCANWPPGWSAM